MRLIDADNLVSVLEILCDKTGDIRYWEQLKWIVGDMPTIDPVKHGRWVMQGTAYGCSLCKEGVIHPFHNYCPNCGAQMAWIFAKDTNVPNKGR